MDLLYGQVAVLMKCHRINKNKIVAIIFTQVSFEENG